jgi:arabinose-5-phosphate isomerase
MKRNKLIHSAKKVISAEIAALKKLSLSINESFVKTVDALHKVRGRVICCGVGKSAKILEKISSTLSSIGISSFTLDPTDAGHGSLGAIKKNDVLMIASFSGSSSELGNIIKYAKKLSIKIIGISSNAKSNLIQSSNIKIIMPKVKEAGNQELDMIPTSSSINLLSLGDCIAISLAERKKFNRRSFGALHPSGSLGKNLSTVEEIMITGKNIPIVKEDTPIKNTVLTISSKRLGCAIVLKNKKVSGFVSDGDMNRGIKKYENIFQKKTKDIMSTKPLSIAKDCLIVDALKLMNEKKITSLIITEKKKLTGIIHMHNILSFLNS